MKMWQMFKSLSIKELEIIYKVKNYLKQFNKNQMKLNKSNRKELNISFDAYESESQYYVIAKKWVELLLGKGLASKTYKETHIIYVLEF